MLLSAYKYRTYPTREQGMRLKRNLSLLCKLYNELRDEKIRRYKENGESLTQTELRAMALGKRRNNNDNLQTVFS